MSNIIVIAPHADDEILGCGASIARHISQNDNVYIIVATNAAIGAPEFFSPESINSTRTEALSAHKLLGIKETYFLDFPAPALNSFPEYKISLSFLELFKSIKPTHLYLPHPGDIHQDHKAIYRAGLVAARPINGLVINNIYVYETLSETEWTPMNESSFKPNLFVDTTNFFHLKLEAIKLFKSQLKEYPHSRSIEAIESLAKYRGSTIGVSRAEAFFIERIIH